MSVKHLAIAPLAILLSVGISLADDPPSPLTNALDCGTGHPTRLIEKFIAAVQRGDLPDPRNQFHPPVPPPHQWAAGTTTCLTGEHIFPFEDSNSVLLTDFADEELLFLMLTALNTLIATEGDNYDFVGFWLNFTPHHTIGAAFYSGVQNDTTGLGLDLFDFHDKGGVLGERLQGVVMMWDVNSNLWQPGDGPAADFTRLALAQEFEHRWAMFLPSLLDGRVLQGNNASCGRSAHWSWRVDGQGSGMEISEWVGADPAVLEGAFVTFNTDTGGVFSYSDLYLMGMVSPDEMDAGNSELRFMEDSNCNADYFGPISDFASANIIASAGERVPNSDDSQKEFRTAWIMIHLPEAPPTDPQLDKAVTILEQHMIDWDFSTIGRSTMDNSLFPDCNCNGVADADDIARGGSDDFNGNGVPDECETLGDLDGDGDVDATDLILLLGAWGACDDCEDCPADLDGDCTVGTGDLIVLLGNWS